MEDLTARQREVFEFILRTLREENYIPSIREICQAFGFASTNAVNSHLDALIRKGYISRRAGAARNLEIAPDFLIPERGVPIVGRVAAGAPLEALENLDGYLDLDALYRPGGHFALRVVGDSMIDAGLWDGDYVIVRRQPRVESGEIGVAVIDGQATVKRFRWLPGGGLELVPENPAYQPFLVDLEAEFRVGGKVVGMHRLLK
ncbi:MAG: transcriptional repressor LexA [Planctomycetota bacterium]|jgi:repressor LexA|nr:transcriptional repressor LexA [Planctomycetota bacterium]